MIIERPESLGERLANTLSHGLGFIAALIATPVLIYGALQRGNSAFLIGVIIYAVTLSLLFCASTVYHAVPPGHAKNKLQVLDHAVIFLFIAGTYTPFTLGVLNGIWGWILLGLVWSIACAGVIFKLIGGAVKYLKISTALYLIMGWLIVLVIYPLWEQMPTAGLLWLLAGGIAFSVGVIFFNADRPYDHFIWHVFVLTGVTCHFFAVLWHA
ncbi:MAG: hemolysin III family protein [Anaerolineae bacterium]|nr:hemolysin III family protein [Anaerolineae bacterium]